MSSDKSSIGSSAFGFSLASIINSFFSLVCAYAVLINSFGLFCMGNLAIGLSVSFAQQYRFAATEMVQKDNIPRAISMVLLLGIIAALIGSNIVSLTENLVSIQYVDYKGIVKTISANKVNFNYRSIDLPQDIIFLSATFKGTNKKKNEIIKCGLDAKKLLIDLVVYN